MTGYDEVVLGDLVYCKADDAAKEVNVTDLEYLDEECNDTDDCGNLDEVSGAELPEEKCNAVKVSRSLSGLSLYPTTLSP